MNLTETWERGAPDKVKEPLRAPPDIEQGPGPLPSAIRLGW